MANKRQRRGSGSIYKVTKGNRVTFRWQLIVPLDPSDPNGPTKRISRSGFTDRAEAVVSLAQALENVDRFQPRGEGSETVSDYAERWLASRRLANTTQQAYRKLLRVHICPYFGSTPMAKVTPTAIGTFYRKLSQSGRSDTKDPGGPLSDNTVNKIHVLLKAIYKAALEDQVISANPFSSNSRQINAPTGRDIRAARPEIECWTDYQLSSFLRWDRETFQDDLHVLWYLIASTGVRRGEALALQWDDINVHRQTIAIRRATDAAKRKAVKTTKTMTDRSIAVSHELVTALMDYRSLREQIYGPSWVTNKAFVFSTPKGELRDPNDITARWTRTVLKAQIDLPNLPRLTLKGLRHTHATLLMEAGTNPKVVQERLGHSSITTTMNTYSHVTATLQQAAAQSFEEMLQAK